ncbi:trimethylamine methyltransferase family protein, partial [Verrucomicrobiota bacterium]
YGVPLAYESGALSGGMAPVTRAGVIVETLAESLSGLVVHQLKSRGAPFIGGGGTPALDMLTSICAYSSPSFLLGVTGLVEMCRYYGLPSWGFAACTDSFVMDAQAGVEYGVWTLMAHLSGANLIHDCGYLGQGTVGSLESILLADETIGLVKAVCKGVEVNTDTLAESVIADVFSGKEQFVTHEQTLRRFKTDHYRPKFLNRQGFSTWDEKGRKDIRGILTEKAREILKSHEVPPLESKVAAKLEKIAASEEG